MNNSAAAAVTLRPVQPEDEEFLCAVYGSTREQELALTPWDEAQRAAFVRSQFAAQQRFYQAEYPDAKHHIILRDGTPVGRLYVDRRAEEMRILDIALLTAQRGQGLGRPPLEALMAEAARAGQPLTIYVESYNRSRTLFERLGFVPVEDNGLHILYAWRSGG